MKTAKPADLRRLIQEKGNSAWVEMTLRYGKTFRVPGLVVTCEPEAVRALLMEKTHTEVRSRVHKVMARLPGANGILFMEGEPWLRRIKAVMPVFHREHVDTFTSSLRELTLQHAGRWAEQGRMPDLSAAVQQLGAASVLRMGYGLDPDHPLARQLGDALVDYKQTTMTPDPRYRIDVFAPGPEMLLQLPWIGLGIVRLWRKTARVHDAVSALLAEASARLKQPGWLVLLGESGLKKKELADEINHLYGAFNAIDFIITAALYEIGRAPKLALEIRRELESVLGAREIPGREDLPNLPVTRGFMLEILRMYPVSVGIARQTGAPLKLAGEELPAGTEVMILLPALHRHPDHWDAPNRLMPGRWAASDTPRVPYSYAPFLDGLRKCIGRSMAEMQLMIVLSTILRRYDVGVFADAEIPPFMIPRFATRMPFVLQPPLPS
jgi:cytochrome P450